MKIKEYSEEEMWNPNTGRQFIFDEGDFYCEYYDEIWKIDKGFDLYYQQYLQEQEQHILQIEQLQKQEGDQNQNLSDTQIYRRN